MTTLFYLSILKYQGPTYRYFVLHSNVMKGELLEDKTLFST